MGIGRMLATQRLLCSFNATVIRCPLCFSFAPRPKSYFRVRNMDFVEILISRDKIVCFRSGYGSIRDFTALMAGGVLTTRGRSDFGRPIIKLTNYIIQLTNIKEYLN